MSLKSPMEFFRTLPKKTCPECGEKMEEQAENLTSWNASAVLPKKASRQTVL